MICTEFHILSLFWKKSAILFFVVVMEFHRDSPELHHTGKLQNPEWTDLTILQK